jgi:hypothetical protein
MWPYWCWWWCFVAPTVKNRLTAGPAAREVAVAEQTPMPDDERPVVEIEPVAPGHELVPDDERPVPDSGADPAPGATPLPDDERPVPDDEPEGP